MKHHKYIDNRMKEKGTVNKSFINKNSQKIVDKMEDKRKPLYHINKRELDEPLNQSKIDLNEVKWDSQNQSQNNSKAMQNQINKFIERNYKAPLQHKLDEREWYDNISKSIFSETGFIPIIDPQSKALAKDRETSKSGDVFQSLYNDATLINSKKFMMMQERYCKIMHDETRGVTFKPWTSQRQIFVPKYVDPKTYLKINDNRRYFDQYKKIKIIKVSKYT